MYGAKTAPVISKQSAVDNSFVPSMFINGSQGVKPVGLSEI